MNIEISTLAKKYNVPGPRYTSYPTVPYWETSPTSEQWVEHLSGALAEAQSKKLGAAIYCHIPFCESLCTYCGCNTRISRNHAVSNPYIDTVLKEWNNYLTALGKSEITLSELHLGGGTPTFLAPQELSRLLDGILSKTKRTEDYEFSIEVDPRVTNKEHLAVLREFGFKRISMGIQDFDPKVQEIVHRIQSVEMVRDLTEECRKMGFESVNYDLIYGLPFQTLDSIQQTLTAVRDLRPDRIAFYAYAHVPWIKASQRRFTEADLPQGENKRALYDLGRDLLEAAGYREIGMDHFSLETDSLWTASQNKSLHRNFMGYTARNVQPVIALGVSAIGDAWTAFAQNEKLLETYSERVNRGEIPVQRGHILTSEDLIIRKQILNLMTNLETTWDTDTNSEEGKFIVDTLPRLQEFEKDGLIEMRQNGLQITELGRIFLRNICMAFDARLLRKAPETRLFSQTV